MTTTTVATTTIITITIIVITKTIRETHWDLGAICRDMIEIMVRAQIIALEAAQG